MYLSGIDISHHNRDFGGLYDEINKSAFVIMKASEGKTYIDPMVNLYIETVKDSGAYMGFYHFARADNGNSPIEEAQNFLSVVRPYIGKCLLALDVEGKSLTVKEIDEWAFKFLDYIYKITGIKPLLYVQRSAVSKFNKVAKNDYGLWMANYIVESDRNILSEKMRKFNVYPFPFVAIWQHSSRTLDYNLFNGSPLQLNKYMEKAEDCTHCPIHCPD